MPWGGKVPLAAIESAWMVLVLTLCVDPISSALSSEVGIRRSKRANEAVVE